jgi:hypothetical protein
MNHGNKQTASDIGFTKDAQERKSKTKAKFLSHPSCFFLSF